MKDIMEHKEWWDDDAFIDELYREYTAWENGSEKGYTQEEIEEAFTELKSKRDGKS